MPLLQSQASSGLLMKPQSLPYAQPQWQAKAPLLLLIGHDQAGVQDVLFRLPRAVPGERSRKSEAALLPTGIPRGYSCSNGAHHLQALAPFLVHIIATYSQEPSLAAQAK